MINRTKEIYGIIRLSAVEAGFDFMRSSHVHFDIVCRHFTDIKSFRHKELFNDIKSC